MRCASNWGDPMRLDVSVYTNRGGREINEDSVRWGVRDGSGFFTVADGLGGCGWAGDFEWLKNQQGQVQNTVSYRT